MGESFQAQKNLAVVVKKEEVVAAALPMQHYWLPLSNLDLLFPPIDVGVFFCYTNPTTTTTATITATTEPVDLVETLKKALSQALVSFYAFAGEMVANSAGEPELLCNNYGVDFVEAVANVDLKCLNLCNPDDYVEGKLIPKKKHGVLAIQVTFFKCGGLVVGCTFDHRIADAYSANMFLVSWAEMARPTKPTISIIPCHPCFRRSLLSPRRPNFIHPTIHDMYVPFSNLPPPKNLGPKSESDSLISRIYYVTAEELQHIQSLANSRSNVIVNGAKRTKLESFCAFLWKMVATTAKGKRDITKMGIVVDGRKRLSNGNDKEKALLMGSYFGNVLSIPFGGKPADELIEKPLSWVAHEVHAFLEGAMTEEHFLSLIDWVEAHRPAVGLSKVCWGIGGKGEEDDGPAFAVSSGQTFPQGKVDFGWGKPIFGSYHLSSGDDNGYVMPMPSPAKNGDWVVYMYLQKGQLEKIESEAAHVFKPLTWDYLYL